MSLREKVEFDLFAEVICTYHNCLFLDSSKFVPWIAIWKNCGRIPVTIRTIRNRILAVIAEASGLVSVRAGATAVTSAS